MKTVELHGDALSHSSIVLAPLPTRPFNPGGIPEGRGWDQRGNATGWSDDPFLDTNKYASQPAVHEGRSSLTRGDDFATGRHHNASHPTGPRIHGREVLVNPFDPHQHLRTRSLSGFHRDTPVDNSDTFRTAVTNH